MPRYVLYRCNIPHKKECSMYVLQANYTRLTGRSEMQILICWVATSNTVHMHLMLLQSSVSGTVPVKLGCTSKPRTVQHAHYHTPLFQTPRVYLAYHLAYCSETQLRYSRDIYDTVWITLTFISDSSEFLILIY